MKRASLALLLGVLALAGCGGAATKTGQPQTHSQPPSGYRHSQVAEIDAARYSNIGLFHIFPPRPGARPCAIPMSAVPLNGTCRTSVAYPVTHSRYPEAFVRFEERWGLGHASSWTVIVQWPAEQVVVTRIAGETSPQMRYALSARTPGDQSALDAAADYARRVASAADVFAGVAVDDPDDEVIVHLVHAPQSVIDALQAGHPNTYVIDNNAPRTMSSVMRLANSLNWNDWKARGVNIVELGPTENGHLRVGVTTNIAKAQAAFDAKYGAGVARVVHAEKMIFASLSARHN